MCIVYVLSLEKKKFYVGKTENLERRLLEHFDGQARSANWTRKYKPIRVIETFEGADGLQEDKVTLSYMIRYGIDNVRGGPYVSTILSKDTRAHILLRARMACNLCAVCGSPHHFMKQCKYKHTAEPLVVQCHKCNSPHHFPEDCEQFT
ncbi:unnamed protein product [Ectocarpus sp. 6 AP-2014]